jgi:putative endonuclease
MVIPYFVYIVRCVDDSLYTGITTDVERRFLEHSTGKGGRYTKAKHAVELLYSEPQPDKSSALRREFEIKKWNRVKKLELINAERLRS